MFVLSLLGCNFVRGTILASSLVVCKQNQTTERLRHFQANGAGGGGGPQQSFEETIHRVSKVTAHSSVGVYGERECMTYSVGKLCHALANPQ